MFGLAGGLIEYRSALFAAHGIASLALPYFRYDDLPDSFADVTFDYFRVSTVEPYSCRKCVEL